MKRPDIHEPSDFFEHIRANGSLPQPAPDRIDVAVLDMNHDWPNLGHDSIVHMIMEAAAEQRPALLASDAKLRVISCDIRKSLQVPSADRFALFIGTGGPGHLDPRLNDGVSEWSQGIADDPAWEAPLFRLFDGILAGDAAFIGICHSFGLLCRWSGAARVEPRAEKSTGMPVNMLTNEAAGSHPWFSRFAASLPDHRRYRVVDNRLFDLIVDAPRGPQHIAFESEDSDGLTMLELAREDGMPRVLGVNHHPEIMDREHVLTVLAEKRVHHEVSERWIREREETMNEMLRGEAERQSRLTSEFTLLGPLRFHLNRLIERRCGALEPAAEPVASQ